jgi:hypothetical protein
MSTHAFDKDKMKKLFEDNKPTIPELMSRPLSELSRDDIERVFREGGKEIKAIMESVWSEKPEHNRGQE